MDILETMKARHSVRQYKNQAIESSKREKINALIKDVNAESKLSIQVFYDEPKCFDSFMAHRIIFFSQEIAQKCSDLPVVLYDNNVRHYFTSCPVTASK